MLDPELKTKIQDAYSQFLQAQGLKARSSQKQMIAQIARTLAGIKQDEEGRRQSEHHLAAIEAGTGTGKTLAYLLSALPIALDRDKRLVIATATTALQEQLIEKDIPQFVANTDFKFTYVLAKGRGRYLCLTKAEQLLSDTSQPAFYEDEQANAVSQVNLDKYQELLNEYAAGRWNGDRDNLTETISDEVWQPLTSTHLECNSKRCKHYASCPSFQSRQSLDRVDLVIANQDLVLADLALGGGAILPAPEESIYIFDEAHHLGAKSRNHFSGSIQLKSTEYWLYRFSRELNKLLKDAGSDKVLSQHIQVVTLNLENLSKVIVQTKELLDSLLSEHFASGEERYRFAQGKLPESLQNSFTELEKTASKALVSLDPVLAWLEKAADGEIAVQNRALIESWFAQVSHQKKRLSSVYEGAQAYSKQDSSQLPPKARWINKINTAEGFDMDCWSSPIAATHYLQENLWQRCYAAILTSATLTSMGSFQRFGLDLGLSDNTDYLRLLSPFDFYNSAEFYVPAMDTLPDAKNADKHTDEVGNYLLEHLPKMKAALVLFSSWRQMFRVQELIPDSLKEHILVQGEKSKIAMVSEHKSKIDKGQQSILFGLASFAEGIDLPKQYLTEVIITKLPFGTPDDPVDATLAEWIKARGGNEFVELSIPIVAMRLTQATGRLLRTEEDKGRITLLDRRIITRRYGRDLLNSLPNYRHNFE